MENTPTIEVSPEEAKKLYGDYAEVVKTRKEKYLKELKKVYKHLSRGGKVLDIYEVFKSSGINKEGQPSLGICRADIKRCYFRRDRLGSGVFSANEKYYDSNTPPRFDVDLPSKTFPDWKTDGDGRILNRVMETSVPIVPAHLLPKGKLDNYFILFEVEQWDEVPEAKDPFLLRRINANAFLVLAEWDLTDVEMAVIRGR